MLITITAISILAISALAWLANKVLPFRICPICTGVFLTWAGLVGAHIAGYSINLVIPALLMGGSVVGIAYQFEKKFRSPSAGVLLLWKALFIIAGFVAAYAVLEQLWVVLIFAAVFLFLILFMLLSSRSTLDVHGKTAGDIEKKMEDCC